MSSASDNEAAELQDVLQHLCQHVVSLNWYEGRANASGILVERPQFFGASGFLLDFRGRTCFITAGHVFTDLANRRRDGSGVVHQASILDHWGTNAIDRQHRIPFDFTEAESYYEYDPKAGLDFALIALSSNTGKLLRANGIRPFFREDWFQQSLLKFQFHCMVGFALENVEQRVTAEGDLGSINSMPRPTLQLVDRLDDADIPKIVKPTTNPQFVAKLPNRDDVLDIKGMSGCPIFGFTSETDDSFRYWPVAMQSRWFPKSQIIIGCPIPVFAQRVEDWLDSR